MADDDGKITTGRITHLQAPKTDATFPISSCSSFPTEFNRNQSLNQHYTSAKQYHFNGASISFPPTPKHDRRRLIASFDHPLRKRLREIQSFDLENLLGYGPQWINKEHLRTQYSASKPWLSRDRSMSLRDYMPEASHSRTHLELSRNQGLTPLELQGTHDPMLPNVTDVMYSYNPGNAMRSKPVIDSLCPPGRSITKVPNYSTRCSVSPYVPHVAIGDLGKATMASQETRNEDDLLGSYCRWFDNLSSAILERNIGEPELGSASEGEKHKAKSKNEGNYYEGSLPDQELYTEQTRLDLGMTKSLKFEDERGSSTLTGKQHQLIPLNCNNDDNGDKNKTENNDYDPDLENDDLDQPFQTIPQETEAGIILEQRNVSVKLDETKDELFMDKLVCIVQHYVKANRPKTSDDSQCQEHNAKGQEDKETDTVMEETILHKQKEQKRRNRIEVLRKLLAQQENKLVKLKRQASKVLDDGQDSQAQEETSAVLKKIRRQDVTTDAVSQSRRKRSNSC